MHAGCLWMDLLSPVLPAQDCICYSGFAKGKEKAAPTSRSNPGVIRRSQPTEIITIDDSDDERETQVPSSQQRSSAKRKRGVEGEVEDFGCGVSEPARSRRRTSPPNHGAAPEVIVIED